MDENKPTFGYINPEPAPTARLDQPLRASQTEQEMLAAEAQDMNAWDQVSTAFTSGSNVLYQTYRMWDEVTNSGPADPSWNENVDNFIKENKIAGESQWRFRATRNELEASKLLARMQENERGRELLSYQTGTNAFVAEMIAGFIDVDAPLTLMTMGLSKFARAGYHATKMRSAMTGAFEGSASAGLVGVGSVAVNPNEDWSALPAMLLGGTALGGTLGAMAGRSLDDAANQSMKNAQEDIGANLAMGSPQSKPAAHEGVDTSDPWRSTAMRDAEDQIDAMADAPADAGRPAGAFRVEDVAEGGADSAGAARVPGTGPRPISEVRSERKAEVIRTSRDRDTQLDLENQRDNFYEYRSIRDAGDLLEAKRNFWHNAAVGFQKMANRVVGTDFDRLINTDTSVGRVLAYDLFESAAGVFRNNANAARYQMDYKTRMLAQVEQESDLYYAWAKDRSGASQARAFADDNMRAQFNREVIIEMMNRFYGRTRSSDPVIKQMSDKLDKFFELDADLQRGRRGEGSVRGAEALYGKTGYFPQGWVGTKFRQLLDQGRKREDIDQAIYEAYKVQYPKIKDEDLRIYAKAVVDRNLNKADGHSTNISSWINADGRTAVEDFIARQNNISSERARAIVDGLTNARAEAQKAGHLKERMDVDFSFRASNGIEMFDLLDTDIRGILEKRASSTSGRSALARKGIYSRSDFEDIVDALVEEQNLQAPIQRMATPGTQDAVAENISNFFNMPKHAKKEDLMAMYNYFAGQPPYGGINPYYAAAKKMANLSFLQQLGMAQMAEWGTNMSAVGVREFFRMLPDSIRASMGKHDSPLMKDMEQLGVYIPDDRIHRFDQTYSEEKLSADDTAWMAKLNGWLNKGSRVQGFTSLFYTMNRAQHHMAVDIGTSKLMRHLKGDKSMSDARFRDALGGDAETIGRLSYYAENVVEYDAKGNVVTLNLNDWDPKDVDSFARYINAYTRQQVQRAMIGESNVMFHKDGMSSLFWHLKSFPLLALQKQFSRNAMIGDAESMGAFLYGLAWAATAYTTKQVLSGNTDNLEYDRIARGAFNMSNMTGWLPMWADPVMTMFGMGEYGLGFQGPKGASIISVPPVFAGLDRMAQIPGAILGDGSSSDLRALQAFPIVGNAYGISAIMNALKDGQQERRRAERAAERTEEQVQEDGNPVLSAISEVTGL